MQVHDDHLPGKRKRGTAPTARRMPPTLAGCKPGDVVVTRDGRKWTIYRLASNPARSTYAHVREHLDGGRMSEPEVLPLEEEIATWHPRT